jgi:alkaline phosphatase
MFGGGRNMYVNRSDSIDLIAYARDKGYQFISTVEGMIYIFSTFTKMLMLNCAEFNGNLRTPVIGLFAMDHMDFEIDRDPNTQPR